LFETDKPYRYASNASMKTGMKKLPQLIFMVILIPSLCHGEGYESHDIDKRLPDIVDLSPGLQNLLSQEMRQLQKGMMEILPLYVSGKWVGIASIASKMENSYIFKKSLTEEQAYELHARLPRAFIELDQQFHYLSGMLEQAANDEKSELVSFYYSKMSDTCLSCHTRYATHRFPALVQTPRAHGH
jgi:hypothetical protein